MSARQMTPRNERRAPVIIPLVVMLFALAVAVLSAAAALQVSTASGGRPLDLLPLAQSHDAAASRLLSSDPAQARAETLRQLALQPASAPAWLRMAELDAQVHGKLTAQGLTWLGRSYEVGPFDPQVLQDRTRFAYDHWAELDEDMRQQTIAQVKLAWPIGGQRAQVVSASLAVKAPAGRMTLAMQLFSLRIADAVANSARDRAAAAQRAPARP